MDAEQVAKRVTDADFIAMVAKLHPAAQVALVVVAGAAVIALAYFAYKTATEIWGH